MTFLGKIFTVLIFVMSVVFMSFSVMVFATHKNWKMLVTNDTPSEKYDLGLVHQLAHLNETNNSLRNELDGLNNQLAVEQAARRHRIGALEEKRLKLEEALEKQEALLREKTTEAAVAAQAAKDAQNVLQGLRDEVKELRNEIRDVQGARDELFLQVVELTDKLHGAAGLEKNLKERQNDLLAEISRYKRVMDKLGINPNMSVEKIPPPLDGIVTAVSSKNLIEVSLGSDDGLKTGHRLEVFRNNLYLGHAIVLKTDPDRSVAQIDEKSQRGLIKVQDRVATKLSRTGTS
jgi:uncharacterized protein YlxW (UPF0749 family)